MGNQTFAKQVIPILQSARQAYNDYHLGKLTQAQLQTHRLIVEAQLATVLDHPPDGGWPADAQALPNIIETMRLQGKNAMAELFSLLTNPQRSPPQAQLSPSP